MATMDIISSMALFPANFCDVGGGASREKVTAALQDHPSARGEGILVIFRRHHALRHDRRRHCRRRREIELACAGGAARRHKRRRSRPSSPIQACRSSPPPTRRRRPQIVAEVKLRIAGCDMAGSDLVACRIASPSVVTRTWSDEWHAVALGWNWDVDLATARLVVSQDACDAGPRQFVFWQGALGGLDGI